MIKRIVVEPGSYACLNMGDVAMMQVAVARLGELWPHAEIEVLTSRPDLLSRYSPSAIPISAAARGAWLSERSLIGGLHRKLPPGISAPLRKLEKKLWLRRPGTADLGYRIKKTILRKAILSPTSFRKRLTGADLLVVSGMGGINDAFRDSASLLLDELEVAIEADIPVLAFGQGIGPISDSALLAKARAVLPRLKLISLREENTGLTLLQSLGVSMDRIHVTGDDAIELAFQLRPGLLGNLIGINLRLADYAGSGEELAAWLRKPLLRAVRSLKSFLVAVPISFHEEDSDVVSIARLMDDQNQNSQAAVESPEDVIRRIGNCRVVVTGSYHGGVFALAQGIPVVGLVNSPYYEQKFTGLQQQFPGGCRILDFRRPVTSGEIEDTIREAWESAEEYRESLLNSAARQIELSRAAYQAAHDLYPLAP